MVQFYAFHEGYEYLIVKITQINKLKNKNYKSAIIDIGVYDLVMKYKEKPFPKERIEKTFDLLNNPDLDRRWLIATADYPALRAEFNMHTEYNNVMLTLENWNKFSKTLNWKQGIYTLQARSISNLEQIKSDYSLFPLQLNNEDIPYIGIGSLCRLIKGSKSEKIFVKDLLKFVRARYPKSHIHVWGASIHHLEALYQYADSFDNTKWTRPCNSKLPHHPCRNKEERNLFFRTYLKRIHFNGGLKKWID